MKRETKIPRLFKLPPKLDAQLRKESKKTNINQTRIVELALLEWLRVKRS